MGRLDDTPFAGAGRWISRFGPYVALVLVVTLVVGVTPGKVTRSSEESATSTAETTGSGAAETAATSTEGEAAAEAAQAAGAEANAATGEGSGGTTSARGSSGAVTGAKIGPLASTAGLVPNCDAATGRIKIPMQSAPACVPAYDGNNGGPSTRGVGADSIKIAVYRAKSDPTTSAILSAANAEDDPKDVDKQIEEWAALFNAHYNTYGRKVQIEFVRGSAAATDDAAARADAIKVVNMGAFASLGAPNNTYIKELAANKILCIECAIAQPKEFYEEHAPYVWSIGMSSSWGVLHGVEWIEKNLWGKKAEFAGDPVLKTKTRALGSIHYDTPDGAYTKAFEMFVREMAKRGMHLASEAKQFGYPCMTCMQEQARPIIQKMIADGVTTVLLATDPFTPIFFTQEATRQGYFPEWNITGTLVDTTFFARLYDQQQMAHDFATTTIASRMPEKLGPAYVLFKWHYGREPTAQASYQLSILPQLILFAGIHYAGERLSPQTFRDGLFNAPAFKGGTRASGGYGRKLWPGDDYTYVDDVSYIWWDPNERGKDEIGNDGVGMYRYVEMGKRFFPGEHKAANWFDKAGTVTIHNDYPAGEKPPDYPPPPRG
jgi:hypothetical protein